MAAIGGYHFLKQEFMVSSACSKSLDRQAWANNADTVWFLSVYITTLLRRWVFHSVLISFNNPQLYFLKNNINNKFQLFRIYKSMGTPRNGKTQEWDTQEWGHPGMVRPRNGDTQEWDTQEWGHPWKATIMEHNPSFASDKDWMIWHDITKILSHKNRSRKTKDTL